MLDGMFSFVILDTRTCVLGAGGFPVGFRGRGRRRALTLSCGCCFLVVLVPSECLSLSLSSSPRDDHTPIVAPDSQA